MTTVTLLRSKLNVYDENAPAKPLVATTDGAEIARLLGEVGVRFERWTAEAELAPDADSDAVLAAYASSVKRVQADASRKAPRTRHPCAPSFSTSTSTPKMKCGSSSRVPARSICT